MSNQKSAELRPRGRDEVKAALLEAANELFGRKGPDDVSVRDVAAHAGVNHALVHRHFGSKEKLLQEVLMEHAVAFREAVNGSADASEAVQHMFEMVTARPAFTKILAQLLLSGHPPAEFALDEGGVAKLTQRLLAETKGRDKQTRAQMNAAISAALSLGWTLFAPFLLYAVGFEGSSDQANAQVSKALTRIAPEQP